MNAKITQVIGCAYTYRVSQAVRDRFSIDRKDHSAHKGMKAFSYFKKVEYPENIIKDGGKLVLRKHPETGEQVDHWYEPELALLLGAKHTIIAYALANDLTAAKIEFEQARQAYDPTYFGKCWKGSCSIGPRFFNSGEIRDVDNIEIGLRIIRSSSIIYDKTYSTSQRLREFRDLPSMILERLRDFHGELPASKQILIEHDYLPEGTVILAGTGLIVPKICYAKEGDLVTIYSPQLEELRNSVILEGA